MSDEIAEAMFAPAAALVCAVADRDAETVAEVIADMSAQDLRALAVVLASMIDPDRHETVTGDPRIPDAIAEALGRASDMFRVPVEDITGLSRRREACDARAVVCYAGFLIGMSYSGIGRVVNRDHSTVIYACNRVGETTHLRRAAEVVAASIGWTRPQDDVIPIEKQHAMKPQEVLDEWRHLQALGISPEVAAKQVGRALATLTNLERLLQEVAA